MTSTMIREYALVVKDCAEEMIRHADAILADETGKGLDHNNKDVKSINSIGTKAANILCLTGYVRDRMSFSNPIIYTIGGGGGGGGGITWTAGNGGEWKSLGVTRLETTEETPIDPLKATIIGNH